jgi:hypothetical protein
MNQVEDWSSTSMVIMVENGVQLTLTSTLKSTGKTRISADGLNNGNGSQTTKVSIGKHIDRDRVVAKFFFSVITSVSSHCIALFSLIYKKKPFSKARIGLHMSHVFCTYNILKTGLQGIRNSVPGLVKWHK